MTEYSGLGGIWEGRNMNPDDLFEIAVNSAVGNRIRSDEEFCRQMWSALANVDWKHTNGDTASYSFRAAGDMIAAMRGEGNYMDWYCSGPEGVVSDEIREAMAAEGWVPEIEGYEE